MTSFGRFFLYKFLVGTGLKNLRDWISFVAGRSIDLRSTSESEKGR